MNLTPVKKTDIGIGYRQTKLFALLQEFANSEHDAVRVDNHHYKSVASAANTLNKSAKRFSMYGIRAISRGNALYLIKEIGE